MFCTLAWLPDRGRPWGGGLGTSVPTGVGRFMSTILAGGGMVVNLDPGMGAGERAGIDGRGWAVELAYGVMERSITVPATCKWPADGDKLTLIVSGRYCLCVRLWLEVLMVEAVLLFRDGAEGTGEVARTALVLLPDPRLSWVGVEAASSPLNGSRLHPHPSACGPRWSREVGRAVVLTMLFLRVGISLAFRDRYRAASRAPTGRFGVHHAVLPSLRRG